MPVVMRAFGLAALGMLVVGCVSGVDRLASGLDGVFAPAFPSDEPGCAVVVVKEGKIVYDRGFGIADMATGERISSSTVFNICSVSKQFSAVAMELLAADGLLSLDDPVSRLFPEFPVDVFEKVTWRHILSHTSGIPDARPRTAEDWERYSAAIDSGFSNVDDYKYHVDEPENSRYMELLTGLSFEPGTAYEYMNPTYSLIEKVVERVTGERFEDWMRQRVFEPAGMVAEYFHPGIAGEHLAHGYERDASGAWQLSEYGNTTFFRTRADGGIYTSPLEFVKWDAALYGDKVMTAAMREEVHTPRIATDIPDTYYGYGWFIERRPGQPGKIYHTGDNGGFFIYEGRIPSSDVFYLIFANRSDWDRYNFASRVDSVLAVSGLL